MFQRQKLTLSLNRVIAIEFPNCDPALSEATERVFLLLPTTSNIIIHDVLLSLRNDKKFVNYFLRIKIG